MHYIFYTCSFYLHNSRLTPDFRRASSIPLRGEACITRETKKKDTCKASVLLFGDPSEARTPDTLLKRQVLCQLS